MKPLLLLLATVGVGHQALAETRGAAARLPKKQTANHGEAALASYYGCGCPQDFYEARRQARLAGGGTAATVVEALCWGRGKGGEQDAGRALKLLAPLLLKGEPLAQAASALILGQGNVAGAGIPAVLAEEFRAELAAVRTYDPAVRSEQARLALTGLRPRVEKDAVACVISGQLFAWGLGIPKNEARAGELFRRAWALGCSDAANQLGNLFNEGEQTRRDHEEALRWFRLAADTGNAMAQENLALFDAALTPPAWLALMTASASAGNSDAMGQLGMELLYGARLPHDAAAGRQWLEKAAAGGRRDDVAQFGKLLSDNPTDETERRRGFKLLREAAAWGSALAANYLSFHLMEGRPGLPANPRAGYLLAALAVERGQSDALSAMALALEKGLGVPQDVKAARKCLEAGFERGSAGSAFNLAVFLEREIDGAPDPKLVFRSFLFAAEHGNFPGAAGQVGGRLLQGVGVEKDAAAAVPWLRQAVAEGDWTAMSLLGSAYLAGQGVAADPSKALSLFRQAADAGDAGGMYNLGICLQQGKGQPADPNAAFPWLLKAADLGMKEAFMLVSRAYETGSGARPDPAEAWSWLVKAAEAGDPGGCFWLGEGYRTGRMGEESWEKAFFWYSKGAELKHPTATNNLGCCYQFGNGVTADPDRAFALYTRAAELGEPMALINLAICHEGGVGTPVNAEKALELRRKAAAPPPK